MRCELQFINCQFCQARILGHLFACIKGWPACDLNLMFIHKLVVCEMHNIRV